MLPRRAAARIAHIAVRAISLEGLTAAAGAWVTRAEPVIAATGLADREIRSLPRDRWLPFAARQLRTNQRTMNGAFVGGRLVLFLVAVLLGAGRFLSAIHELRFRRRGGAFLIAAHGGCARRLGFLRIMRNPLRRRRDGRQDRRRIGFLALSRHARVLVFVIRVAGRATRLLDVVTNHRDDDMIGEPPLARTVIIQNVTRPKLALLHQRTPDGSSLAGKELRKARQS